MDTFTSSLRRSTGLALTILLVALSADAADIAVNTFEDELNVDGDCSLREAIQAANTNGPVDACSPGDGGSPDTVHLPAGTYSLGLPGSDEDSNSVGDIDIVDDVQIIGSGAVVDASTLNDRILDLHSSDVTLDGITLQRGTAAQGGAVRLSTSKLSTANVVLRNNTANQGGAIFAPAGSELQIYYTVFLENAAKTGGGLYLGGTLQASTRPVFRSNHADRGGGVYLDQGTMSASYPLFLSNSADRRGGGVMNSGGALDLIAAWFIRNQSLSGGAIANAGDLRLESSHFTYNSASRGGAVANTSVMEAYKTTFFRNVGLGGGGGIHSAGALVLDLDEVSMTENEADVGGALYIEDHAGRPPRLRKTTIYRNTSDRVGGAVYVLGGTFGIDIANSTISGNLSSKAEQAAGLTLEVSSASIKSSTLRDPLTALIFIGPSQAQISHSIVFRCDLGIDSSSGGYNTFRSGSNCATDAILDRVVADVKMAPLAFNGGFTPTHRLLPGSPAIDAASNSCLYNQDQRGSPRPIDGDNDGDARCDSGSYELDPAKKEAPQVFNIPTLSYSGLVCSGLLLALTGVLCIRRYS